MTSQLFAPIAGGVVALLAALVTGYWLISRSNAQPRPWRNAVPLLTGLLAGFLLLAVFIRTYTPDRFYSVSEALQVLAAVSGACVLIWLVEVLVPREKLALRAAAHVGAQVIGASLIVWAGVQFVLLEVPGEGVTQLGAWSALLTVIWLIFATNIVRLLDGIHGAASVVVIIAALAGVYSSVIYKEYFLTGFGLVAMGCVMGSLRFCMSEKRLPLEGSGTAIVGLLFATLTVLARQKSVAAILLMIPLVLIALIAGAAMLGFLEKHLLLSRKAPGREIDSHSDKP